MAMRSSSIIRPGIFLVALATLLAWPIAATADTKRVTYDPRQKGVVDGIGLYNSDSCHSLVTNVKVKQAPKHGRMSIQKVNIRASEGPCKGRSIQIYAVVYKPNRGFKGKDEATVGYRAPPRRYYSGSIETLPRTTKYIITVN